MANAVTRNYLNRIVMQPAVGEDEGCGGGMDGCREGGREWVWEDRVRSRKVGRRCEGNKRKWKRTAGHMRKSLKGNREQNINNNNVIMIL